VRTLVAFRAPSAGCRQSGFSMIEMLVAAFIMAIGILGLTLLQTMAMRTRGGTKSMTSAILVAERVLDQAEALGRNSLLCSRTSSTVPVLTPNYFGAGNLTQYFDYDGTSNPAASYYTVTITPTDQVVPVAGVGGIKTLQVTVQWSEEVNASKVAINRNITLSRRIPYATS